MIARTWRASATTANSAAYERHFATKVAPHLNEIAGHRGAYLLRRTTDDGLEFIAITLWDSMETIKTFAGPQPELAIVEPEGRAVLSKFDDFANHYDVAYPHTTP